MADTELDGIDGDADVRAELGVGGEPVVPVPAAGGRLLVAFGVLLLGGVLLPFASAAGSSSTAIASDIGAAMPVVVLALASFAAAWGGHRGYDVAPALGGGAVLVFSVLVALVAPVIKALFDLADAFGGSITPGPGLLAFIGAAVVGGLVAGPILRSVGMSRPSGQMPPALGWVAAAGTGLYLWGVTRPAYPGAPLLTGDWYVDAVLLALLASLLGPAVLVATVRTAASAALLAGALLFPAMSWFMEAQSTDALGISRSAGFDEMGMGLVTALAATAYAVFRYASQEVEAVDGRRFVPAVSAGAATIAIAVIVVLGLVGLSADQGTLDDYFGLPSPEVVNT